MNNLFKKNIKEIQKLCIKFNVKVLYSYGSAVKGNFTESSGIDLLVHFKDDIPILNFSDNYFAFSRELEKLLGKQIDLTPENSIQNPYLAKSIEDSKELIYEREGVPLRESGQGLVRTY